MQIQVCLSVFAGQKRGAGPHAPPGFCGPCGEPGQGHTLLCSCSHVECTAGGMPTYLSERRQSAEVAAASTSISRVPADPCPLTDAFKISKCNFFLYNLDTFHIAVSALVPGANESP